MIEKTTISVRLAKAYEELERVANLDCERDPLRRCLKCQRRDQALATVLYVIHREERT